MPTPLNILQLNSARKYIGEAAHTLNLTEALRQRGHSVWLGLRGNFDTIERARVRDLKPIAFNMPHRWWPPQDVPDIRHIARLVREHRIDLIHAHRGKDHWQAVLATRLCRVRVPVIRTRHVVTPLSGNAANRWLAQRTAALIIVSKAVEQDVRATGMYADERLVFIPGGVDLNLFRPASQSEKDASRTASGLVAVCVARFAVVKAQHVLIRAWAHVHEKFPAARLLLVGDGKLMPECQDLAKKLGLDDAVVFLGRSHSVPELLNQADFGVLSSVGSEGFSRAVLEYMAKGIPTVATRVGAVPDLIEDGVHGVLVAPNDEAAMSAGLLRVLNASQGQRDSWGRSAREKAERGYGYEGWAAAHEQLYARVIGQ